MPYDDPSLKEFTGYFEAKEPGQRARADAWATAIGLQKVDGFVTSRFLVETAKDHIEGRITQAQARRRIHDYYAAKDECESRDSALEEPDKVAERIVAVINERGFEFTPEYFLSIHRKLFSGVLASAGKIRTVNIAKHEWVLKDDTVTYGSKDTLLASLARDFLDERAYDYNGKAPEEIIPHFVRFIAQIWQVHPFAEGNSRTTAVFAIKYLRSLGYRVASNMFRENSWYFRNALVRANYADYARGVKREWGYLEAFFRNLLLGERHELKSRYLLIGISRKAPSFEKKRTRKSTQKSTQTSTQKILGALKRNPRFTRKELACEVGITADGVKKILAKLKADGRLRRIGPDNGGYWEVRG